MQARLTAVTAILATVLALACGADDDPGIADTPPFPDTPRVYFYYDQPMGGPFLVPIERPGLERTPEGVIEALLEGPTEQERAGYPAAATGIPRDVELISVNVEGDTATASFTGDISTGQGLVDIDGRLAQVVYTLTALPGVEHVRVVVNGVEIAGSETLTRQGFADYLPPVFVEAPAYGAVAGTPLVVHGNVAGDIDEVTLLVAGRSGRLLVEKTFDVSRDADADDRRRFVAELEFTLADEQAGVLMAWSGEDRGDLRTHPLRLVP